MEFIRINKKDLVRLYGESDNLMVNNMLGLMLKQTLPEIKTFLETNKDQGISQKVEFLSNYVSSFSMVGLSAISVKIDLTNEKIKNKVDHLLINEAFSDLEKSIHLSEQIIGEYLKKINKTNKT